VWATFHSAVITAVITESQKLNLISYLTQIYMNCVISYTAQTYAIPNTNVRTEEHKILHYMKDSDIFVTEFE